MSILTPPTPATPEDLLSLPDGESYELVDGKLVERHMGLESSEVAAQIIFLLLQFLRQNKAGRVFSSEASYQCFPHAPQEVRRPDVSFVRSGRFEGDRLPRGHCKMAPDLAAEVISPNDLAFDVEEKVALYLGAGVKSVWVVYPPTRTVKVHRDGVFAQLTSEDAITETEILPGFSCKVSEFFV